ncbi:MAG: zinc-binding dehydrogenase [bacterium]
MSHGTMRAISVAEPGGIDTLIPCEQPIPDPGLGEIRIRNRYGSCNFMDVLGRRGDYPVPITYPWIPGSEGMGIVDAVGVGVTTIDPGDRVAYIGNGSYSEYGIARENGVVELPDSITDEQGAAFPIQGLTAWHILHTAGRCTPGEWVVIHAAAGGVGGIAVQLAKRAGLKVIATASTDAKIEYALGLGADYGVNYSDEDFMKAVRRITEGRGVDIVLDSVGQDTIKTNFRILTHFGRVVAYGLASGMPEVAVSRDLFPKSLGLHAFSLYNVLAKPELFARSCQELMADIAAGDVLLTIDSVLPLEQAEEAHRKLEGRGTIGKVLLAICPPPASFIGTPRADAVPTT